MCAGNGEPYNTFHMMKTTPQQRTGVCLLKYSVEVPAPEEARSDCDCHWQQGKPGLEHVNNLSQGLLVRMCEEAPEGMLILQSYRLFCLALTAFHLELPS